MLDILPEQSLDSCDQATGDSSQADPPTVRHMVSAGLLSCQVDGVDECVIYVYTHRAVHT